MKAIEKIGQMLYAIPLIVLGILHMLKADLLKVWVPSILAGGTIWIYITGLGLIAAGLSIIFQKKVYIACTLLGIMLLLFALVVHLPGIFSDDPIRIKIGITQVLKDCSMAGGAFILAGIYKKDL